MLRFLAVVSLLFVTPILAQGRPELSYDGPGSLSGHWEFRNFSISSEGSDTFGEPAPYNDLELVEAEGGNLIGTLSQLGVTFPVAGKATYKSDLVTVELGGEFAYEGETYLIKVFGYLMPLYMNADEQRTMIFGQSTRYPKANPEGMGANPSFIAIKDF